MKKFTLFTFLFLLSMTRVFAQNITNPSFETWAPYGGGAGSFPTGWTSSDSASMALASTHTAVQELVEKCHLNSSVKITTWSVGGFLTVPGVATNGTIKVVGANFTVSGGNDDGLRNDTLTGCYEYIPQGTGNVATISAVLLKRNGSVRDTIGAAIWNPTPAATMTYFSIPFVYRPGGQFPDSILVVLSSSALGTGATTVGSVLIVDNLALKGITSNILSNNAVKNIKVYPQPASDVLNIDANLGQYQNATYSVLDGLGRVVKSGNLQEKQQINISSLAVGIYTVAINSESGEKLYTTRITVRR